MQNYTLPNGSQIQGAKIVEVTATYLVKFDDGDQVGMNKKPKIGQLAIVADDGSYMAIDMPVLAGV